MSLITFTDRAGRTWHLDRDAIAGAALRKKKAVVLLHGEAPGDRADPATKHLRKIRVDVWTAKRVCREIADPASATPREI
mgnify:FL=1